MIFRENKSDPDEEFGENEAMEEGVSREGGERKEQNRDYKLKNEKINN